MKNNIICIIALILIGGTSEASNWYDSAVVRIDNGYVTYYDSISKHKKTPSVVRKKCKKYYTKNNSRNQIFEINYYDITLYVVRYSGIDFEHYDIWAYNQEENRLSESPFILNGLWSADNESGFDVPIIKGQMLEISENNIILRERVHNGTSYNAVLLYCITCDKNLEFNVMYCVEEISICNTPEMEASEYLVIRREVTKETTNDFQVNCFSEENNMEERFIGSYSMSKDGTINNINIANGKLRAWLITTSGIEPQLFSKQGSSYYARKKFLLP